MCPVSAPAGDVLSPILTKSDSLTVGPGGELVIDGCSARSLVEEYGSPLFVISERTLRVNLRRLISGLAARWPRPTRVLYAIKSNNNLAVRAIANSEGAGGDCFGLGELHATFAGGADPSTIVLNGSSKSDAELARAVELGLTVNVDAEDEVPRLAAMAVSAGRRVRVNLRLKVASAGVDHFAPDLPDGGGSIRDAVLEAQWGLSVPLAARLAREIAASPSLDLTGYHIHVGRVSRDPAFHEAWGRAIAETVAELRTLTGLSPRVLDVGGGYPRERDVESGRLELNPHPVEAYLDGLTAGLRQGFESHGLELPELWIEPGRYVAGNAGVLLGTVGSVKRDLGKTWVHVDFSVNNLLRIDLMGVTYHLLAAGKLREAPVERVDVVGPLCAGSPLGADRPMPRLARGDLVAALDAGMYAEIFTARYNGVPLPATVLVNDGQAEVIKERESVEDVFSHHRIPERLRPPVGSAAEPGYSAPASSGR